MLPIECRGPVGGGNGGLFGTNPFKWPMVAGALVGGALGRVKALKLD